MAPVVELNDKPLGMEGLMAHNVVAPTDDGRDRRHGRALLQRQIVSAVNDGVGWHVVDGDVHRGRGRPSGIVGPHRVGDGRGLQDARRSYDAPVLLLYVKPVGSAGLNAQLVTVPPLTLGMLAAMATPLVRVMFSWEKLRPEGRRR